MGNSPSPYMADLPTGGKQELSNLVSSGNGTIWVGTLPYGTYEMHETGSGVNKWFTLTVDDSGVTCTRERAER